MNDIEITVISKDKLTKTIYYFDCGDYCGYMIYRRNTSKQKFGDAWPEPLAYDTWCKRRKKENCFEWMHEDEYNNPYKLDNEYREYVDHLNPVLRKTRKGESMARGSFCGDSSQLEIQCPKKVLAKAKKIYASKKQVIYE